MKLHPADVQSPTWTKIKIEYQQRLEGLRRRLEVSAAPDNTEYLRGQIAECRQDYC
jgi:hypothetical protein